MFEHVCFLRLARARANAISQRFSGSTPTCNGRSSFIIHDTIHSGWPMNGKKKQLIINCLQLMPSRYLFTFLSTNWHIFRLTLRKSHDKSIRTVYCTCWSQRCVERVYKHTFLRSSAALSFSMMVSFEMAIFGDFSLGAGLPFGFGPFRITSNACPDERLSISMISISLKTNIQRKQWMNHNLRHPYKIRRHTGGGAFGPPMAAC